MKTLTLYFVLAAFLGFATLGLAELIDWSTCSDEETSTCTIHEVGVKPCREAASGGVCRIKRGRVANIYVDFTPNFSGETLTSRAYWASASRIDLPFIGMDTNACNWSSCPVNAGTRQTYNYTLSLSRTHPPRNYDIKWKLWNEDNKECCFLFQIKLVS